MSGKRMSGEYNPSDYLGNDEEVLACGHSHPCAMRCEDCRKRSCPDCTHIFDNVMTCARCAPGAVEFLTREAGQLAALDLTNEAAVNDLRQTVAHAGSLARWSAARLADERALAVRLVTRPTMEDALKAMGVK